MKQTRIIIILFLLWIPGFEQTLLCQEDTINKIEALFSTCDNQTLPGGFAVALIKSGKVIFKKGYGYANNENKVAFTTSTVTDYASVAKQFTGFAVAKLIIDGKLQLNDDVRLYLPELPYFGDTIRIKHLLYHTSGIRDWVGLVKISGTYMDDVITDDFIMKLVYNQKNLNFKSGEKFQYSNTGYFLLAQIISRITGKSFCEWTKESIFSPLNMDDTQFRDDYGEIIENRAYSYKRNDLGNYARTSNNLEAYGSSSLFSSLDDVIKWVQNFGNNSFASKDIWNLMMQQGRLNDNQEVDYGFGISFGNSYGQKSYGHGGSWNGFLSEITFYPELDLVYILSTNRDPSGVYVNEDFLRLFVNNEDEGNNNLDDNNIEHKEIKVDQKLINEYEGIYKSGGNFINAERVEDHLVIHFSWGESYRIYPESNNRFFIMNTNLAFSFLRDENGEVNRVVYHYKGTDTDPFLKVESDATKYPEIKDLCGDYISPELQTTYTVKIKDNRLIVAHLHNEDVQLVKIDTDTYIGNKWWFKDLELIRDENNTIVGFKLSADQDNIQNLVFNKK